MRLPQLRFGVALLPALAGCGLAYQYPDSQAEQSPEECSDGVDNDLDGRADCLDLDGCAAFCSEANEQKCADGVDNNHNGQFDCDDGDCARWCGEHGACTDGADNDLDGSRDCADSDCRDVAACREDSRETCADGIDNDLDERADCADDDCQVVAACREDTDATCSDGIDNDLDGRADCADDDCAESCGESTADTCADGEDNDQDDRVDCDDPNCDGNCPEQEPGPCTDERDNDGDGLTDASDPLCWPFAPPVPRRCATLSGHDVYESFEVTIFSPDFADYFGFGNLAGDGRAAFLSERDDTCMYFGQSENDSFDPQSMAGLVMPQVLSGGWAGFVLSFTNSFYPATKLSVALLPSDLVPESHRPVAGPESAVVAVTLDASVNPPVFALDADTQHVERELPLAGACGSTYCNDGWGRTTLEVAGNELIATVSVPSADDETTDAELRLPLLSDGIRPARLVVWGGSSTGANARLDDLSLSHDRSSPCGFPVPQIPPPAAQCAEAEDASSDSLGHTVSVARAETGFCALVTAGGSASAPERVLAWRSSDGASWKSGVAASEENSIPLPSGGTLVGAAVVRDEEQGRWLAAVAYRAPGGVELGLTGSDDCKRFDALADGPLLPPDAEALSFVIRPGRHEIYFTRPPVGDTGRTLWRAAGSGPGDLELEDFPLYELPSELRAVPPVAVQRVGEGDLVMTFPALSVTGGIGIDLLVGDATGSRWQGLPAQLLTIPATLGAAFDSLGAAAAALTFDATGGVLIYGGRHEELGIYGEGMEQVAAGTALLAPAGGDFPPPPAARCGDAMCDTGEACEDCPEDCSCSGPGLVSTPLASLDGWEFSQFGFGIAPEDARLFWATPVFGAWAFLPFDVPVSSDFELSFDVPGDELWGTVVVGLGSDPAEYDGPEVGEDNILSPTSGIYATLAGCYYSNDLTLFFQREAFEERTIGCNTGEERISLQFSAEHRHVVLRRERGNFTLEVSGDGTCLDRRSLDARGLSAELSGIVVEAGPNDTLYPDTEPGAFGSIGNLKLTLLEDQGE